MITREIPEYTFVGRDTKFDVKKIFCKKMYSFFFFLNQKSHFYFQLKIMCI